MKNEKMKKIYLLILALMTCYVGFTQEAKSDNERFLASIHYTGNIRNNNVISNDFNGIIGIELKYNIINSGKLNFQGGLGVDFFKSRDNYVIESLKNTFMINPNFGVELKATNKFRPFLNVGITFFKITNEFNNLNLINNPSDPAFYPVNYTFSKNYNGFSINPGFRVLLTKQIYFQTDYKYIPVETNFNIHLINVGFGCKF